ncbi:hypothetical protein F0562_031669 [Nyssa sinensis]|uniref:UDP-glycosyltransferases domain-containing protein n=1 Tax=Nyssa sinensis TaxID=561372 RepID=A0A5J5AV42_9ASTE|nr:hypothetical protein F0562_031669 [Nyssa sinensis]
MDSEGATLAPHVLIFTVPIQGHINCNLQLAELLCHAGLDITMLVSHYIYDRLLRHSNVQSRFARYPGFCFKTISDGLPDDHPRAGPRIMEIVPALRANTGPLFREMMISSNCLSSDNRRPVTTIIADGLSFVGDFALEKGIQLIYFRTVSACSFWACFCMQELIEAGEIPLKGNGMNLPVKSVPGMESFLRRRDLPGFCRVDDLDDPRLQVVKTESRQTPRAQAVIKNTFEDLEGPILSQIRTHCPNLYSLGPLHAHLKARIPTDPTVSSYSSTSIWEEDRSCVLWLDAQPAKSVLYVSFGSVTVVTRDQLIEFWYGLVNSGQRFLWVIRPDSIVGEHQIPAELLVGDEREGVFGGLGSTGGGSVSPSCWWVFDS